MAARVLAASLSDKPPARLGHIPQKCIAVGQSIILLPLGSEGRLKDAGELDVNML